MTAFIFLLIACSMTITWLGNRKAGGIVFAAAALLSVVWLNHHFTDSLPLAF